MRALLLLGLMVATPVAAADQFDLVCTAQNGEAHYRIDLEQGVYCEGKCTVVRKIETVEPNLLTLEEHKPQFASDHTTRTSVNRVSGEWTEYFDFGPTASKFIKGTCAKSEFSGIPQRKF